MKEHPYQARQWFGYFTRRGKELQKEDSQPSKEEIQAGQIATLNRELEAEKQRNAQLVLLNELSQQLETRLDLPVAAQLAVNVLERAIRCSYVSLLIHEPDRKEFVTFASAGRLAKLIPPGYRQSVTRGMIGRAVRLRKTQISNDTRLDPDYFDLPNENSLSSLVVPIIHNGYIEGMIEISSEATDAFHSNEVALAEAAAAELERAWERTNYHLHLTEIIQAGNLAFHHHGAAGGCPGNCQRGAANLAGAFCASDPARPSQKLYPTIILRVCAQITEMPGRNAAA